MKHNTKKLVLSGLFLAIGLVLPFLTGQIPEIGNMISPMHFPVLLCGFICGAPYGALVGLILRTKRHLRAHRHHLGAAGRAVRALPQLAAKGFLHPLSARLCAGKSAGNRKRCRTAGHPHLFCAAACLIFVLHKLSNLEKTGRMWYNALGIPKLYVR